MLVTSGIYTSSSRQTTLWTVSETVVRHPGRRWKKAICVGAKCGPLMRRCETSGSEIPHLLQELSGWDWVILDWGAD